MVIRVWKDVDPIDAIDAGYLYNELEIKDKVTYNNIINSFKCK